MMDEGKPWTPQPYQEGIMAALDGGKNVVCVMQPPRPKMTVGEFGQTMLDRVAAKLGLTFEQMAVDYNNTAYSAAVEHARHLWAHNAKARHIIQRRLTVAYFSPHGPRIRSLLGSHTGRRRRRGERLMQSELRKPEGYFWKGRPAATIIADEVDNYG